MSPKEPGLSNVVGFNVVGCLVWCKTKPTMGGSFVRYRVREREREYLGNTTQQRLDQQILTG